MKILGIQAKNLMALAQQSQASGAGGNCAFTQMLQQALSQYKAAAAGSSSAYTGSSYTAKDAVVAKSATSNATDSSSTSTSGAAGQVKMRLDQAIAEAFLAPLLAQGAINAQQTYFLHSPAEQAYAQQMYTQIASQIGSSGRMPLAKGILKAVLQQMGDASQWKSSDTTSTPSTTTTTGTTTS